MPIPYSSTMGVEITIILNMGTIFSDADVEAKFRRDGYVVQPLLGVEEIQALYDLHQSTTLDIPSTGWLK